MRKTLSIGPLCFNTRTADINPIAVQDKSGFLQGKVIIIKIKLLVINYGYL